MSFSLPLPVIGVALVASLARSPGHTVTDSAPSPFARAKAEALLRERLPCLGCHRLDGQGGRIGPDLSDVAARRPAAYIAAMVSDPQRTLPGTIMPRTPMPRSMRDLVVRYLSARTGRASVSARASATAGPPPAVESAAARAETPHRDRAATTGTAPSVELRGDVLYARHCAACHGASGAGDGPNARDLPVRPAIHASREAMSRRPDDTLFDAIAGGGYVVGKSVRMPAFGETLTREQIVALVRHIRTLCRCEGPAWSTHAGR